MSFILYSRARSSPTSFDYYHYDGEDHSVPVKTPRGSDISEDHSVQTWQLYTICLFNETYLFDHGDLDYASLHRFVFVNREVTEIFHKRQSNISKVYFVINVTLDRSANFIEFKFERGTLNSLHREVIFHEGEDNVREGVFPSLELKSKSTSKSRSTRIRICELQNKPQDPNPDSRKLNLHSTSSALCRIPPKTSFVVALFSSLAQGFPGSFRRQVEPASKAAPTIPYSSTIILAPCTSRKNSQEAPRQALGSFPDEGRKWKLQSVSEFKSRVKTIARWIAARKSQEEVTGELPALREGPLLRLPVKLQGDHWTRDGDTDARCCHAGRMACQCLLANYGSTTYQPPTLSPLSGSLTAYTIHDPTPLRKSPALSLFSLSLSLILSASLSLSISLNPPVFVSSFLFIFLAPTDACTTYQGLTYLRKTQSSRKRRAKWQRDTTTRLSLSSSRCLPGRNISPKKERHREWFDWRLNGRRNARGEETPERCVGNFLALGEWIVIKAN